MPTYAALFLAVEAAPAEPVQPLVDVPHREGLALVWHDDFEHLDAARWSTSPHTFEKNAAQFDAAMVRTEHGRLVIGLDQAPAPTADGRSYLGGELRTAETFTYGRFEARARFARGSGVVSSLFTFYDHLSDPDLEENWNEIDIEFVGKSPEKVQFNIMYWDDSKAQQSHEHFIELGYDATAEFHDYAIEWLPEAINFYVDDVLVHSQAEHVPARMKRPSRLMLSVWPVSGEQGIVNWAGAFDDKVLPAAALYEWVRVYAHAPEG